MGHDARIFSYCGMLSQVSPFKSKTLTGRFYKTKTDNLLAEQIKDYRPDIIYISFARFLNSETLKKFREAAPQAILIGGDGDPWPKLQPGRIETAKQLDILTATNDGQFLRDYRDAGVPLCAFMPNMCDPDTDYRYEVGPEWKTDILWTGKAKHGADSSETLREEIVGKLIKQSNAAIYGCFGKPQLGGTNYLYAISGAKIGVSINAVNSVRLYHSDRFTHYTACGTFTLAKKVPDTELLFKDGVHVKYFNTAEEFFELAKWYLEHENERRKIADACMQWAHQQYNSTKIAQYLLDLIETGSYKAPWM
ncbi:MAG TPA: glycosyltransferase [Sedimentisphaerales bacterium]|nr:glycosyltransferase [Sedimentisphaerales bacterium]